MNTDLNMKILIGLGIHRDKRLTKDTVNAQISAQLPISAPPKAKNTKLAPPL